MHRRCLTIVLLALMANACCPSSTRAQAGGDVQAAPAFDEAGGLPQTNDNGAPATEQQAQIADRNLLGIIKDGGVLMIPILVCSFILLVFVFERTISLR